MSAIEIAALLVVLSAVLGWVNHVYVGLPHAIGLLLMGLLGSLAVIIADSLVPGVSIAGGINEAIEGIDFYETVMNGMLSFLLFAAALHVDVKALRSQRFSIAMMATAGVLVSAGVVGTGLWLAANLAGIGLPLPWALVFGALISPTDPVAVLSVLKRTKVPQSLQAKIAGESLFNDGVGVVAFTVFLAIAMASSGMLLPGGEGVIEADGSVDWMHVAQVFGMEVFGAILLGAASGWTGLRMIRTVDDAALETLITLALVLGTYGIATKLHVSGPIAVVIPGLIMGNWGANIAMSATTKAHLFPFWTMVDEILNSVLFLLIGLEVLVVRFDAGNAAVALICIPVVLFARYVSVSIPAGLLRLAGQKLSEGAVRIMTWGGVRGGISVALALSLPESGYKDQILAATYVVVVFSILVQGLTIAPLVRRISERGELRDRRQPAKAKAEAAASSR